jgi:hypothetical protein
MDVQKKFKATYNLEWRDYFGSGALLTWLLELNFAGVGTMERRQMP